MDTKLEINNVIQALHRIREREAEELRTLTANPSVHGIAQMIADALHRQLNYLCNFSYVVDHRQGTTDIHEIIDVLEGAIQDEFYRLTGTEYQPDVCRQAAYRKRLADEEERSGPDQEGTHGTPQDRNSDRGG